MRSFACAAAFFTPIALATVAVAQPRSPTPSIAPSSTAVPSADTEPTAAGPAKPLGGATGYAYGPAVSPSAAPRVERRRARTTHPSSSGSDAFMPGFETLSDGSTRLFVELTKAVAYDTKAGLSPKGLSTITYVLKGAHVERRNNQNPLVTVHFNTPMASARLIPRGQDVWFVVDMRANVSATATMDAKGDGGATLHVTFPKGDYLPKVPIEVPSPKASEKPASPEVP